MLKQFEQGRKSFKKLGQQEFACYKMQTSFSAVGHQTALSDGRQPEQRAQGALPRWSSLRLSNITSKGACILVLQNAQDVLKQLSLLIIASNDLADDLSMEKILSD